MKKHIKELDEYVNILHDKLDNLYSLVHEINHLMLDTVEELKAVEDYLGIKSERNNKIIITNKKEKK